MLVGIKQITAGKPSSVVVCLLQSSVYDQMEEKSSNRLTAAILKDCRLENVGYSKLKKSIRFDLHIVETLKKIFLYSKRDHFAISINDKCTKEPLNLRSEQAPKYDTLS